MKVKEYLRKVELMDAKINQKQSQLDELREKVRAIGGMDYTKDRVQTSHKNNAQEGLILKCIEMEEEINKNIDDYIDFKNAIIKEINTLSDVRYIKILFKRYIEYKSLYRIAQEMEYSYDHIRRLHGHALENLKMTHNATIGCDKMIE